MDITLNNASLPTCKSSLLPVWNADIQCVIIIVLIKWMIDWLINSSAYMIYKQVWQRDYLKVKRTTDMYLAITWPNYSYIGQAVSDLGSVVQKPINVNPRLRINQGIYFSTPKCCSTLIFGEILH